MGLENRIGVVVRTYSSKETRVCSSIEATSKAEYPKRSEREREGRRRCREAEWDGEAFALGTTNRWGGLPRRQRAAGTLIDSSLPRFRLDREKPSSFRRLPKITPRRRGCTTRAKYLARERASPLLPRFSFDVSIDYQPAPRVQDRADMRISD